MTTAEEEGWKQTQGYFRDASTKFSELVRQATLGGIAFSWLFADRSTNGVIAVPPLFALASIILVIAVLIDAAQYYYTAWAIDEVLVQGEKSEIPKAQTDAMHAFFHVKTFVGAIGLVLLAMAIVAQVVIR